jgi:hypothetical protein
MLVDKLKAYYTELDGCEPFIIQKGNYIYIMKKDGIYKYFNVLNGRVLSWNGEWMEFEMKDIKKMIKEEE